MPHYRHETTLALYCARLLSTLDEQHGEKQDTLSSS